MVGQLVSLNRLYANIQTANENEDAKAVYHYAGRTVYLLLTFDPIDLLQFEPLDASTQSAIKRAMQVINLGLSL